MRLEEMPIINGLDKIAGKLLHLNNKYLLNLDKEDLNPEIPLSDDEDWDKNWNAIFNTRFSEYGTLGMAFIFAFLEMKEAFEVFYHFNDSTLSEVFRNCGEGMIYGVLGLFSTFGKTRLGEQYSKLWDKRENKYNIQERNLD